MTDAESNQNGLRKDSEVERYPSTKTQSLIGERGSFVELSSAKEPTSNQNKNPTTVKDLLSNVASKIKLDNEMSAPNNQSTSFSAVSQRLKGKVSDTNRNTKFNNLSAHKESTNSYIFNQESDVNLHNVLNEMEKEPVSEKKNDTKKKYELLRNQILSQSKKSRGIGLLASVNFSQPDLEMKEIPRQKTLMDLPISEHLAILRHAKSKPNDDKVISSNLKTDYLIEATSGLVSPFNLTKSKNPLMMSSKILSKQENESDKLKDFIQNLSQSSVTGHKKISNKLKDKRIQDNPVGKSVTSSPDPTRTFEKVHYSAKSKNIPILVSMNQNNPPTTNTISRVKSSSRNNVQAILNLLSDTKSTPKPIEDDNTSPINVDRIISSRQVQTMIQRNPTNNNNNEQSTLSSKSITAIENLQNQLNRKLSNGSLSKSKEIRTNINNGVVGMSNQKGSSKRIFTAIERSPNLHSNRSIKVDSVLYTNHTPEKVNIYSSKDRINSAYSSSIIHPQPIPNNTNMIQQSYYERLSKEAKKALSLSRSHNTNINSITNINNSMSNSSNSHVNMKTTTAKAANGNTMDCSDTSIHNNTHRSHNIYTPHHHII